MNDYAQTGFQSACSEFSENTLSLDEYFLLNSASRKIVRFGQHAPIFGINQNDLLLIDINKSPISGDLLLVANSSINGIYRFEYKNGHPTLWPGQIRLNQEDELILAPILLIIKELVSPSKIDHLKNSSTYLDNRRKQDSLIQWNLKKK